MQRTFAIIKPDAVRKRVAGQILARIEGAGFTVRGMRMTHLSKAEAGTMRKDFGASIDNNATHGSDAPETAAFELGYFFRGMETR